jgi:hypothetical protein
MIGQSRTAALVGITAAALALAACVTLSATSIPYVGAPRPPAVDPATVQIMRTVPSRPHDQLGEIIVDASIEPAPPIADVEAKLRSEAAQLGADAVVVVLDRVQPVGAYVAGPYWSRSVQTIAGRKLVGIAIKYR